MNYYKKTFLIIKFILLCSSLDQNMLAIDAKKITEFSEESKPEESKKQLNEKNSKVQTFLKEYKTGLFVATGVGVGIIVGYCLSKLLNNNPDAIYFKLPTASNFLKIEITKQLNENITKLIKQKSNDIKFPITTSKILELIEESIKSDPKDLMLKDMQTWVSAGKYQLKILANLGYEAEL